MCKTQINYGSTGRKTPLQMCGPSVTADPYQTLFGGWMNPLKRATAFVYDQTPLICSLTGLVTENFDSFVSVMFNNLTIFCAQIHCASIRGFNY